MRNTLRQRLLVVLFVVGVLFMIPAGLTGLVVSLGWPRTIAVVLVAM